MMLTLALYWYDSFLLLARNEAVLVRGWRNRWRAGFGANGLKLGAREPYLPNPLTPHWPLFRLSWSLEGDSPEARVARPLQVPDEIALLQPFAMGSGLLLFMVLPIVLFLPLGFAFLVGTVAALYLNILVALGLVFWRRRRLHLSSKQFAGQAFECLVCPPFSVNLIRRLCAKIPVDESFTAATARLVPGEGLAAVNAQCLIRLEEQMDFEPEGSARMSSLEAAKARFTQAIRP